MRNLAGNKNCDIEIEHELTRCKIEIVRGERQKGEVPASITGKLGSFTFRRAWYYWVVYGNMPLEAARELYNDPVGKTDIRVVGHAGCPPPEEWAVWLDADGKEIRPASECRVGQRFVTSYHIDSEVGLRIFADMIRKHNLS